jgi:phage/plasmid-associated DNA primase
MGTHLMGCTRCGSVNVVTFDETGGDPTAVPIQHEHSNVSRFVAARCTLREGARTDTANVVGAYLQWCQEVGEDPLPQQAFGRAIVSLFDVGRYRSSGRRYYLGLALQ